MLKPERLLILVAVTAASLFGEDSVQIKELTATQKKALSFASEKLRLAQMEYDGVAAGVKAAHGVYSNTGFAITADCYKQRTEAELISDKWVKISSYEVNACAASGVKAAPIK